MKTLLILGLLILSVQTSAKTCELSINGTDQMQFDVQELSVSSSCKEVKLTLNHTGSLPINAMGHNWVLSKTSDFQAVAQAGMGAGADNDYIPQDDDRVLAHTKVIGGGDSTSIIFSLTGLDAAEQYSFFCSFPGHWSIMKGQFKII